MLQDPEGYWVSSKEDVQNVLINSFAEIDQGTQHSNDYWEELNPKIDQEHIILMIKEHHILIIIKKFGQCLVEMSRQ